MTARVHVAKKNFDFLRFHVTGCLSDTYLRGRMVKLKTHVLSGSYLITDF